MVSDGFRDEISILSFIDRGKQAMTKISQLSSRSTQGGNSSMCLGEQNEAGISGGFEEDKQFMIYIYIYNCFLFLIS